MSIRQSIVAAAAALLLSLPLNSAFADPVNKAAPAAPKSTFTLIRGHSTGGGGGGRSMSMGHSSMGAGSFRSSRSSFSGQRFSSVRPSFGSRFGRVEGRRFEGRRSRGGRTAFYNGRRGHWRNGHWYGLGVYAGGSCYWNCRAQGYGPGYCSAYAYDFCY